MVSISTIIVLLWAAAGSAAGPDACLNACAIERNAAGALAVVCSCAERGGRESYVASLWGKHPELFARFSGSHLLGATDEERRLAELDACAPELTRPGWPARTAKERRRRLGLTQRPLCECVVNRAHVPIVRSSCRRGRNGANTCEFALDAGAARGEGAVRPLSLYDYQACVVAKHNFTRPQSCERAACAAKPPACPQGAEAVNIADPEACCPVYECAASTPRAKVEEP